MDPQTVSTLLGTWGYSALFVLLLLTGIGSPIPDDLLLLTAGYLVFTEVFHWPPALAVSLAGVVISDVMLYSAGRHLAWRSNRWSEGRLLSPKRLQRATRWFARVGDRLVFIARLTPGTRVLVFVTAGVRAVPLARFVRYDALGALLWVPAMLALGHASGRRIGDLEMLIAGLQHSAVWVLVAVTVLLALWLLWGREESKL